MYDPMDERIDQVFSLMLTLLRGYPDALGKQVLSRLFEEQAVLEILVEQHSGLPLDPAEVEAATVERWDRAEELRDARAEAFLHALQREEG
jgi:glutathione S-transferase